MSTILNLFGRSPFSLLQAHMDVVSQCVHNLILLFQALEKSDQILVEKIGNEISELEHQADLIKNDIRNHLPKTLFLPINRSSLLEVLSIQDSIADHAEDVAVLLSLKPLHMLDAYKTDFFLFLNKNIEAFEEVHKIMKELHELVEFSFGGIEAERINEMIDRVAFQEHEVDVIQRGLIKKLFQLDEEMGFSAFYQWQKIFECIAAVSNLSEKLAFRIRMMLELG